MYAKDDLAKRLNYDKLKKHKKLLVWFAGDLKNVWFGWESKSRDHICTRLVCVFC